eukprot:s1052_g6.t3
MGTLSEVRPNVSEITARSSSHQAADAKVQKDDVLSSQNENSWFDAEAHMSEMKDYCKKWQWLEFLDVFSFAQGMSRAVGVHTCEKSQDVKSSAMSQKMKKVRREKIRDEKVRREKMQMREKDQLLMAPELDISGPAVYAMKSGLGVSDGGRLDYAVLVAGVPAVSTVSAALRPARGKPKEEAETQLEVLWQSEDCSLLRATVRGTEVKSQVCRHLHILGFPVWGDRRYGNQRANLRSRAVFGLSRPWCHLIRLELFGSWGGIICESSPPQELLRVLSAVGCQWRFPDTAVQVIVPPLDFRTLEHGLSMAYYVATRTARNQKSPEQWGDSPGNLEPIRW